VHSAALHRTIMAVDVVGYNHPMRTLAHQEAVHEGFNQIMRTAFADTGVPWDVCMVENTGDGAMILLPPEVAKADLVAELPERVHAGLRRYNTVHAPEAAVQLRLALHAGEVRQGSFGSVSQAISFTFRLLDAPEAKSAQKSSGADLALIVSAVIYSDVVVHDAAAEPGAYQRIPVKVKETDTEAWLRLMGAVRPAVNGSPVKPPVRDGFPALVEAMLAVPCLRNSESRRLLLETFPRREIADLVAYQAQDRLHVIALARTCQRFEHGLADLLDAVRLFEPESPQVSRLAEIIRGYQ